MRFAIATRDELWLRGRLAERRLSHGEAVGTEAGLVATDARDAALVEACDALLEELRRCIVPDLRVRLVAEATLDGTTGLAIASLAGHSVVTAPEHLERDLLLLRRAALPPEVEAVPPLPLLWRNGTAAVLLHEAAGHPLEHGLGVSLPEWLHVDVPLQPRRATFRDVPLVRMTNLVATAVDAPFDVPDERIEVLMVEGGAFDPLTGLVTLHVAAADVVRGGEPRRAAPFTLEVDRSAILYMGAAGEPLRYPGVICSREGQELFVGSHAPELVTR